MIRALTEVSPEEHNSIVALVTKLGLEGCQKRYAHLFDRIEIDEFDGSITFVPSPDVDPVLLREGLLVLLTINAILSVDDVTRH